MIDEFLGMEKLSLVDYEGKVAATLFTGGCNFRCPFCHNSSLVETPDEIEYIPFNEIMAYLQKRKGILDAVCITGGEPTLLPSLKAKIKSIKQLGYFVKLDSNGTNPQILKELIDEKLIDYVAMDIKNSKEKYCKTIGLKNINLKNIEQSIELLKNSGVDYEFRTTIVKGLHEKEDFEKIGKWLQGSKRYFLQHFVDKGNCIENNLEEINEKEANIFKEVLEKYIDNVNLRGY